MKPLALIKKAFNQLTQNLHNVGYWSGFGPWWGPIRESFSGAWQQNVTVAPTHTLLSFPAVYACLTGIASDIAKLRIKLSRNVDGIWEEITANQPWLPVLRKPNHYQTRIAFIEQWILSKLEHGNTYVLKERDLRGIVTALYILHPLCVKVLVAEDGSIFYELNRDYLSHVSEENPDFGMDNPTVPASEIIHDMMPALWHPLVGVSPLYACALSATMGNKIQNNSTNLFANASRPGGILTAPGAISDETAGRLKAAFEKNFSGENVGRLAVLGDGLKYEPMSITAEQAQLIDQLKFAVEDVARCFHYPIWKLGGPMPPYSSSPQALTMMYYTDCLQPLIEKLELCLDEGLALPSNLGTEMDIDNLLRMDTAALFESNGKAVGGGWMAPDEARFRANLGAVTGGDSPYLQQQNYSLVALAKRDALADPFARTSISPTDQAASSPPVKQVRSGDDDLEMIAAIFIEGLRNNNHVSA